MARSEIVNVKMSAEERDQLEAAAKRLHISLSEALRTAVKTMAERVGKAGSAEAAREAEFITKQPEWQGYTWRVVSGSLTYDQAVSKCAADITDRLGKEAKAIEKTQAAAAKWSQLYNR